MIVCSSNAGARLAGKIIRLKGEKKMADVSKINTLFQSQLIVLNVGPKSFSTALEKPGLSTVQVNWKPIAGGNAEMQKLLELLGY